VREKEKESAFSCMCVCSHSMLAILFNNLLCQSLRCRRLREHSRSPVPNQCMFTHIQFVCVCVCSVVQMEVLIECWCAGGSLCVRESGRK